jgi:S-adenosylmethionine synthetase
MTVLIAGGSGLVGRCLIELFDKLDINYISTYNTRPCKNGYKIDFTNQSVVDTFMAEHNVTSCINCIVERQTETCEMNWPLSKKINIDMVDILARACKKNKAYLIHISTDYVFDGSSPPYDETKEPNPLNNYGISKLIAEARVKAHLDFYTIIRVPVLYCDNSENLEENAVTLIGRKVINSIEKYYEDDYSIRRPVYIPDFCQFIASFIQKPKSGIFHFYNPYDHTTKYNTAKEIAEYLGQPHTHIQPADVSKCNLANRPYDTQLIDNKYNISDFHITPLKEGLQKCFAKLYHPHLNNKGTMNKLFLLFDLDGTIVDTDKIHYESYRKSLADYGFTLTWFTFEHYINNDSIGEMLQSLEVPEDIWPSIYKKKYEYFLTTDTVPFIEGAEKLLTHCIDNNINFAVVTNTSREIVDFLSSKLPLLAKIKNWVVRGDYTHAKPNPECYNYAYDKFYKGEQYIVGFENTLNGYNAIKHITKCIYFVTNRYSCNYHTINKEDIFLCKDLTTLL